MTKGRYSGLPAVPPITAAIATATTATTAATAAATTAAAAATTAATAAATTTTAAAAATAAATATTAAATTAAAATRATAATTAAAAATALGALFSFVHAQRATVDHLAVDAFDGALGLLVRAHRYEREAAGLPSGAISHDVHIRHFAVLSECSADGLGIRVK